MQTNIFLLLAILTSHAAVCTPLPPPPRNSQLSSGQQQQQQQQPSGAHYSFDPKLKAATSRKRAQGREAAASSALADEKRAYEIEEVWRDGAAGAKVVVVLTTSG